MLFQLEQSQWWPADAVLDHQLKQLSVLLAHAAATVPLYRGRLAALGWSPGDAVTVDQWRQLPVLGRAEVQGAGPSLESAAVPADHGATYPMVTSGSTGRPVQTLGTALTQLFWNCLTLRDHLWHRRDLTQELAVVRQFPGADAGPPGGAVAANWGAATRGLVRTGPCSMLDIRATVREQAAWLRRRAPAYLLTYPSNALAVGRQLASHGGPLAGLREVRTFGELLEPGVRAACRDAWGVPVIDMYSSQEVGYIALQCPDADCYHLQSENLLVEVVDDRGEPCPPGQVGRVVVTSLHNFATPLLRYELGDYAQVGPPCPCGRGLGVLTRVMGRQRNMLTLPGGDQRWPDFGDPADYALLPRFQQFQVVQRTTEFLEVRLVSPAPLAADEEDRLRDHLASTLGHRFEVSFTYLDEILRDASGKFEDFRSDVAAPR